MGLLRLLIATALTVFAYNADAVETRKRIVGGQPTPPDRHPYMAGLHDSENEIPVCGGILIAPNVVLSTAFCFTPAFVSIGCHGHAVADEEGCEIFTVEKVFIAPDFNFLSRGDVYSVIVLDGESENTPISFLAASDLVLETGQDFTTMGWRRTSLLGAASSILLEIVVDYVPSDICVDKHFTENFAPNFEEEFLCAARPGFSVCVGDTGGPLIVRCDETEEDLMVGMSTGISFCSDEDKPLFFSEFPLIST